MSVVAELSQKALHQVVEKVNLYDALVGTAEPMFQIDGRRLEEVLKAHAFNLITFDTALQECKSIEDLVRDRLDRVKSSHWERLNEKHSRSLNTKDIEAYIAGVPEYTEVLSVVLIVVEVRRKLEAVVNALTSMGWSLNNIVKLRVAQLDHITM